MAANVKCSVGAYLEVRDRFPPQLRHVLPMDAPAEHGVPMEFTVPFGVENRWMSALDATVAAMAGREARGLSPIGGLFADESEARRDEIVAMQADFRGQLS